MQTGIGRISSWMQSLLARVNFNVDDDRYNSPFWDEVDRCGRDDCWIWQGDVEPITGHGVSTKVISGILVERSAHRLAYLLIYGRPPSDHVIRHKCRNQLCCNPNHLIAMRQHPDKIEEAWISAWYYSSSRAKRLSEFEKRRISQLRESGHKIKDIARTFFVSTSTISRMLRNKDADT